MFSFLGKFTVHQGNKRTKVEYRKIIKCGLWIFTIYYYFYPPTCLNLEEVNIERCVHFGAQKWMKLYWIQRVIYLMHK